ncbi:MAG: hypothetical protein ABMB14_15570, partial [Myxococcota bacterium]
MIPLTWAVLVGCPAEESPAPSLDSGDTGATGTGDPCADAPITTWDNFGAGFVTQHCDTCHASTTPNRHDAPVDVTFDDEDQVWAWADRILARAAGDEATMPPQGGVS